MATVYLGLGSNLGDRRENIEQAVQQLSRHSLMIQKVSTLIETDPVGGPPQGKFFNAVLEAQTSLTPHELLKVTQYIEKGLGRRPGPRHGPRPMDIDILLYNHQKIQTPELTIPHPRMFEREFVLKPLAEIAPDIVKEFSHENRDDRP